VDLAFLGEGDFPQQPVDRLGQVDAGVDDVGTGLARGLDLGRLGGRLLLTTSLMF
jgi:hypothetical protein